MKNKVVLRKPFFLEALSCIEDPKFHPMSYKVEGFKYHIGLLVKLQKKIMNKRIAGVERAHARTVMTDLFEKTFRGLIFAETAFWYCKFIKVKIPDVYREKVHLSHIILNEDDNPGLLYQDFISADTKKAETKISKFICNIFDAMLWTDTTILRIQQLEHASLKNANMIGGINAVKHDEIKETQESFLDFLKEMKGNGGNYAVKKI